MAMAAKASMMATSSSTRMATGLRSCSTTTVRPAAYPEPFLLTGLLLLLLLLLNQVMQTVGPALALFTVSEQRHAAGFRSGHGRLYMEGYGKIPVSGFKLVRHNLP